MNAGGHRASSHLLQVLHPQLVLAHDVARVLARHRGHQIVPAHAQPGDCEGGVHLAAASAARAHLTRTFIPRYDSCRMSQFLNSNGYDWPGFARVRQGAASPLQRCTRPSGAARAAHSSHGHPAAHLGREQRARRRQLLDKRQKLAAVAAVVEQLCGGRGPVSGGLDPYAEAACGNAAGGAPARRAPISPLSSSLMPMCSIFFATFTSTCPFTDSVPW